MRGDFRHGGPRKINSGLRELLAQGKKPANGGLSRDIEVKICGDRTGNVGREGSGNKRTFATQNVMSALPPKADMCSATRMSALCQ